MSAIPSDDSRSSGLLKAMQAAVADGHEHLAVKLSDPAVAAEFAAIDLESERVRAAIKAGIDPVELGFVENGLEQVMRERGLL